MLRLILICLLVACDYPLSVPSGLVVEAESTIDAKGFLTAVQVLAADPAPFRFQSLQVGTIRTHEPVTIGDDVQFRPVSTWLMACPLGPDAAFTITPTPSGGYTVTLSEYGLTECVEVFNGFKYRNGE